MEEFKFKSFDDLPLTLIVMEAAEALRISSSWSSLDNFYRMPRLQRGCHLNRTSRCSLPALRHSYAVATLHSGDDIKTVQKKLGHATVSFPLDVYGHVPKQMKQASSNRMEAYIKNISGK